MARARMQSDVCNIHLLFAAFTLLAAALSIRNPAAFNVPGFALALGAFFATGIAVLLCRPHNKQHPVTVRDVCTVMMALIVLGLLDHPMSRQGTGGAFGSVAHAIFVLLGVVLAYYYYFPQTHALSGMRKRAAFAGALTLILLRLWIPIVFPHPGIDVFTIQQHSASILLRGSNPYTQTLPSPAAAKANNTVEHVQKPQLAYPPTSLLGSTVGYLLFRDVRVFYALCDAFFAWTLWKLSRRAGILSELLPLIWLLHPKGWITIAFGWTEPFLLVGFACTALAYRSRNRWLTAIAHGLTISLKQYLIIVAPLLWLLERRYKFLLLAFVAMMATALPFLLWDAHSLWSGMHAVLKQWRIDSLSVGSWLLAAFAIRMPTWYTVLVGAMATATTAMALRRTEQLHAYIASACLGLFALFILGKQGFTNYYMLVSGLLVLLIAIILDTQPQRRTSKRR